MNLIGPQTLADRLGVPVSWVYMKCRSRDLPYVKLGNYVRFDVDELDAWVEQHRRAVKPSTPVGAPHRPAEEPCPV